MEEKVTECRVGSAVAVGNREVGDRGPRLPDLMGVLKIIIALLLQAFIWIDALGEYLQNYLLEFLGLLRDIFGNLLRRKYSPRTAVTAICTAPLLYFVIICGAEVSGIH